jgi:hypothetical protein
MTQSQRTNLLGKIVGVAADDWTVSLATAAELRGACSVVTGAARTLLLEHLGAGAGDLGTAEGLVTALLLLGELPAHDALDQVGRGSRPKIASESEIFPASLPSRVVTVRSIIRLPHSIRWPQRGGCRKRRISRDAGLDGVTNDDPGALGARYRALDQDQAAVGIGRDDFEVLRGHAGLPMWPAIFLPLKTLPGSWLEPVEPCERCETDTPWVARRPPKLCRFMAPAKPFTLT